MSDAGDVKDDPIPRLRTLGGWEGLVVIHDDFDELPEEIAAAFAGERP